MELLRPIDLFGSSNCKESLLWSKCSWHRRLEIRRLRVSRPLHVSTVHVTRIAPHGDKERMRHLHDARDISATMPMIRSCLAFLFLAAFLRQRQETEFCWSCLPKRLRVILVGTHHWEMARDTPEFCGNPSADWFQQRQPYMVCPQHQPWFPFLQESWKDTSEPLINAWGLPWESDKATCWKHLRGISCDICNILSESGNHLLYHPSVVWAGHPPNSGPLSFSKWSPKMLLKNIDRTSANSFPVTIAQNHRSTWRMAMTSIFHPEWKNWNGG